MSVKDVKNYYDEVCNQYHDFLTELRDFEDLCSKGMVAPETIEMAKKAIEPLKDNWQKLNYIMFLLNKPNKKAKLDRFKNQSKNLLKNSITDSEVYKQNEQAISNLIDLKNNS